MLRTTYATAPTLLGFDHEGLLETSHVTVARELVVGHDSRWLVAGGPRIDLLRHGPMRRLLEHLVAMRLAQPGVATSADGLLEAGWPGERMRHSAGLLRVYSIVRRLRRLGLQGLLITRDDGYLLDPDAIVRRAQ